MINSVLNTKGTLGLAMMSRNTGNIKKTWKTYRLHKFRLINSLVSWHNIAVGKAIGIKAQNLEECKNYTCRLVFIYCAHLFPEHLFPKTPFPKHLFPEHLFPKPMAISILESDWLSPHHPILNAKFSPIAAFLNRSTCHKSAKVSPSPCPQILWVPQINE